MPHLEITRRNSSGVRRVEFNDESVTIGRYSSNQLVLGDPYISREHCVIEATHATARIRDLDSRLGIRVNQKRLRESELANGDRITIGPYELRYLCPETIERHRARPMAVIEVPRPNPPLELIGRKPIEAYSASELLEPIDETEAPDLSDTSIGVIFQEPAQASPYTEPDAPRMRDESPAQAPSPRHGSPADQSMQDADPNLSPLTIEARQVMQEIFGGAPRYADDRDLASRIVIVSMLLALSALIVLVILNSI